MGDEAVAPLARRVISWTGMVASPGRFSSRMVDVRGSAV